MDPLANRPAHQFAVIDRDRVRQQHRDDKRRAGGRAGDPADGLLREARAEDQVDQQPDGGEEHEKWGEIKEASRFHELAFEIVHLVHIDAVAGLEDLHDQRQADGYFRRRDRDHKEDEDLPAVILKLSFRFWQNAGKRHHRQVGGIQHQLDGHENDQRVAAHQHAQRADGE